MNQDKILVTSSDNIPYSEIEQNYGIVDSQIVVGANLFRDVFAGFRDIFGGETKGYKKDIDKMKNAAISSIKAQAKDKGANAVVSLKIDLDELSGGGKSMFMMNIYGSAVKLKKSALQNDVNTDVIKEFSYEDIKYFKGKNRLIKQIKNCDNILKEIGLKTISKFDLWNEENSMKVLNASLNASYDDRMKLKENLIEVPVEYIEKFLANNIDQIKSKIWAYIYNSLEERNWFNYEFINRFIKDENHIKRFRTLQLCAIEKDFYEKSESTNIYKLGNFITTEFNTEIPTKVVTKMINKKEIQICPNCLNETEVSRNYCECGANMYGLEPQTLTPKKIGNSLIETSKAIEMAFEDLNRN